MAKVTKLDMAGRERNTRPVMRLMEEREQYDLTTLRYDYGQIDSKHRDQVRRAAVEIHSRLKRTVEDMIEIGQWLNEVKKVLQHGEFLAWIRVEFEQNVRDLQKAMQVASMIAATPNAGNYPHLSASALYLLAAPSTPDIVRWSIQERVELVDWRPTRREIKALIDEQKPPPAPQLPPPPPIEAAYSVVEPESPPPTEYKIIAADEDWVTLALPRAVVEHLRVACVGRRALSEIMEGRELDRFFITLINALEGKIQP